MAGFFGMRVIYRHEENSRAFPISYLERWLFPNLHFGDRTELLGVVMHGTNLRMLIRQPAIEGIPAAEKQIHLFFTENEWKRFVADGNPAFCDAANHLVILDTHPANLILTADRLLCPIDLRGEHLDEVQIDIVESPCRLTG